MGIYEEVGTTDTLGRRTGPRTRHTLEEKVRVVEETRVQGASVAMVARRHNLNANQVFGWRRLYRRGLLKPEAQAAGDEAKMLPVTVSTPTVLPTERAASRAPSPSPSEPKQACEVIEIQLRNGHSIVARGRVDGEALGRVIDLLLKR